MVTKKQLLGKFKVVELKKVAKDRGIDVKGSKAEILEVLSEELSKDDIFQVKTEIQVDKPTFNLIEHDFVPNHEVLDQQEAQALLARYNCTKQQLPKIRFNDPIIKMIGAKPGDIIKITRNSQTADKSVYYRVVV